MNFKKQHVFYELSEREPKLHGRAWAERAPFVPCES